MKYATGSSPPCSIRNRTGEGNMALARRVLSSARSIDASCGIITFRRSKHYDPKFRWHRKMKFIKSQDINFERTLDPHEQEEHLRRRGYYPMRRADEIPLFSDSTMMIMDPYVPVEGDGQYSLTQKISQALKLKDVAVKSKNKMAVHKIRKFIANFNEETFAPIALDIYIKAHMAMASNDMNELEKYATEYGVGLITANTKNKTVRWKYIESLDPPKTVQVRTGNTGPDGNIFAQMTVRIHSKQMLAIYDRFGRLMYGSEILAKDVLEYAVFEVQLTNPNATYKLHQKIIPEWINSRYPMERTFEKPKEEEEDEFVKGPQVTIDNEEDEKKELKQ